MNERIKELATEVGISVDYLTNTKQIVLLEKFAELIVRECANLLRAESERLYALASKEENEQFASNFDICAEKTVDNEVMILEHFGVES
jgi:hypothetical protein